MVLLIGIAIPTLESVVGIKARQEVSALASNIRATRGHAAVADETCRMVFCIKDCTAAGKGQSQPDNSYYVECTKGDATIQKEGSRNQEMDQADSDDFDVSQSDEAAQERKRLQEKTAFKPSPVLPVQKLKGIDFGDIWVAHQTEKYDKGKAYLYFFPSGETELANIELHHGEDDWYSIHVYPLSGEIKVVGDKEDIPDQDSSDEEDF